MQEVDEEFGGEVRGAAEELLREGGQGAQTAGSAPAESGEKCAGAKTGEETR